jgi:hypothetical protein
MNRNFTILEGVQKAQNVIGRQKLASGSTPSFKTKIFWYQSQKLKLIGSSTKIFFRISQNITWMITKLFWNLPKYLDQT